MKKNTFVLFLFIILLTGCNMVNSPTKTVDIFFSKYQKLDNVVLNELDNVVDKDNSMNKKQKEKYKMLIEKQYQNLSYKITNEEIYENSAIVDVEIEVLDYISAIKKSQKYYHEQQEEFDNKLKENEYIDYKLKKIEEVDEKRKYKIIINLTLNEGIWSVDELSDIDKQKIHGLYE